MTNKKGFLAALDGGEGSGKSLLMKKILKYFGERVLITREPGGSPYAEEIRKIIRDSVNAKQADAETMFGLFWAARADHLRNTIIPAIKNGKIVISDRFDSSTFAYQICAQKARHLEQLFWNTRSLFLGDNTPDIYVYLDIDPKIGLARKKNQIDEKPNHFDEKELAFHEDVRKGFKEFFSQHGHGIKSLIINAEQSEEDVWQDFKKIIEALIDK